VVGGINYPRTVASVYRRGVEMKPRGYVTMCALVLAAAALLLTGRIRAESPRGAFLPPPDKPKALQVVFVRAYTDGERTLRSQIYKMDADGSHTVKLSKDLYSGIWPDVHPKTRRILYWSERPPGGLHTMDMDGWDVRFIPNTPPAESFPKWGKSASDPFIVFIATPSRQNSAVYRIRPDGTGLKRLTVTEGEERDESVDVVNDKYIIFTRLMWLGGYTRDLFLKSMKDDRAPVNLTRTRDWSETMPAVSNDGRKIAYRVVREADEQIHVSAIDTKARSIRLLHVIPMQPPAVHNIGRIDFSPDDERLFFSVEVTDVSDRFISRRQEIFSVRLDGSQWTRLTRNGEMDEWPSVVAAR
jgi:Tol biopolymer transport system component